MYAIQLGALSSHCVSFLPVSITCMKLHFRKDGKEAPLSQENPGILLRKYQVEPDEPEAIIHCL